MIEDEERPAPGMAEANDNAAAGARIDKAAEREAAAIIRPLIQRLEIHPLPERGTVRIRVLGLIEQFLGTAKTAEIPRTAMMVAEEGLEPPTRGL